VWPISQDCPNEYDFRPIKEEPDGSVLWWVRSTGFLGGPARTPPEENAFGSPFIQGRPEGKSLALLDKTWRSASYQPI
jgi:hypothetical protein